MGQQEHEKHTHAEQKTAESVTFLQEIKLLSIKKV